MKKNNEIEAVCFVGSTHEFLLYTLYYGKEQFERTFFFISDALSNETIQQLQHYAILDTKQFESKSRLKRFFTILYLRLFSDVRWPFLKNTPIYGFDHLWFSTLLLRNRKMVVIEDGGANYHEPFLQVSPNTFGKIIRKIFYGVNYGEGRYGVSKRVSQVVLTGMKEIPRQLSHKAVIINLYELWQRFDNKDFIVTLFQISNKDLLLLKTKTIVILTQPRSNYDEIIERIRMIISSNNIKDILIKTHPREVFNYKSVFPNIDVYEKKVPAELLFLLCPSATKVYTINCTAAHFRPQECQVYSLIS